MSSNLFLFYLRIFEILAIDSLLSMRRKMKIEKMSINCDLLTKSYYSFVKGYQDNLVPLLLEFYWYRKLGRYFKYQIYKGILYLERYIHNVTYIHINCVIPLIKKISWLKESCTSFEVKYDNIYGVCIPFIKKMEYLKFFSAFSFIRCIFNFEQ